MRGTTRPRSRTRRLRHDSHSTDRAGPGAGREARNAEHARPGRRSCPAHAATKPDQHGGIPRPGGGVPTGQRGMGPDPRHPRLNDRSGLGSPRSDPGRSGSRMAVSRAARLRPRPRRRRRTHRPSSAGPPWPPASSSARSTPDSGSNGSKAPNTASLIVPAAGGGLTGSGRLAGGSLRRVWRSTPSARRRSTRCATNSRAPGCRRARCASRPRRRYRSAVIRDLVRARRDEIAGS